MTSYSNNIKDRLRIVSILMSIIGLTGHIFCIYNHMCDHGHCCHPPYPVWQLVSDWVWILLFISSALLSLWSNMYLRYGYSLSLLLLIVSRIGFGLPYKGPVLIHGRIFAIDGILIIESPFILFIVLVALASLLKNLYRVQPGFCKSCGYNLTGNISGVCPECGTNISFDTEIASTDSSTHRHYGWRE